MKSAESPRIGTYIWRQAREEERPNLIASIPYIARALCVQASQASAGLIVHIFMIIVHVYCRPVFGYGL